MILLILSILTTKAKTISELCSQLKYIILAQI